MEPGITQQRTNTGRNSAEGGNEMHTLAGPDAPEMFGRLAELFNSGRLDEMERQVQELVRQNVRSGTFWGMLGNELYKLGKDAIPILNRSPGLVSSDAVAYFNLGITQANLGLIEEAEASYRQAIQLKPRFAEACFNQGVVLQRLGRPEGALVSYQRAVEIKPAYVDALNRLAGLLMKRGQYGTALERIMQSLKAEDRVATRKLFVHCVMRHRFVHADPAVRSMLIRAISEPWCNPVVLSWVCRDIVKLDREIAAPMARAQAAWPRRLEERELFGETGLAAVSGDELLRSYLVSAQVSDPEMECFMTQARYALLIYAEQDAAGTIPESVLEFHGALAQQCFINEYVFSWTEAESGRARRLRDKVAALLQSDSDVPACWLLAVATYFPLNTLPAAERLVEKGRPLPLEKVLTQQIREPAAERQFQSGLPSLTEIEGEVSLQVRQQYEENPYPRWVRMPQIARPGAFDQVMRREYPRSPFRPLGKQGMVDILIAGCGTGQHPIGVSLKYSNARVMAIDLSLASLGYARRKAQEIGLDRLEFAQADIMKLGALERRFDVIESVGVLHHLADPWAGWRVLLSLLRPGGLMCLGFYSEVARQGVVRAREIIADKGYGSTAEDIRRFRQEMLENANGTDFGFVLKSADFFCTSTCRDLLFHVQEHRLNLGEIDAFLKENGLQFLGFKLDAEILQDYRRKFPEDGAATSLTNWQAFEHEHPETFRNMYQFWVQKAG